MAGATDQKKDPDDGSSPIEEAEHELLMRRIQLKKEIYSLGAAILAIVSRNLILFITLAIAYGVEATVSPIPVVTFQPPGILLFGDGTKITVLAKGLVTVEIMRNLGKLYLKGTPEIEVTISGLEEDG